MLALAADDDVAVLVAQRTFDGDRSIAEVAVVEDAGDGLLAVVGFNELAEQSGDFGDVLVGQFLAFIAQTLAHLLPEAGGVYQLQLAFAVFGLAVAEYPDIGADAGVVEHVGRQANDGFDQIVFQHVAANFAFAGTRAAGEQR